MNAIFLVLIVGSVLAAAFGGRMADVTSAGVEEAKRAVELAIGLLGQMALWLGLMRVLRDAGAIASLARRLSPVMRRLFPDVPAEHPAMGAMIMSVSANMLGLTNAATPFGLKAIRELNRLNSHPGVATNSMVLFLAITTSGVAVLPLGVVAVRTTLGAADIAGIVAPSILATLCSTVVGIAMARSLQRRPSYAMERYADAVDPPVGDPETGGAAIAGLADAEASAEIRMPVSPARISLLLVFGGLLGVALFRSGTGVAGGFDFVKDVLSSWLLPVLMAVILLFGFGHRVRVYESFIRGAKEGFEIAVMIIPFLVGIFVAIGMFRASGLFDWTIGALGPVAGALGFPAEALPMALIRPLSGQGALGVMIETLQTYGPDSFVGFLVSVMNGSTDTTFYIVAVYLGSVGVRAARHALPACLAADFTGVVAALLFSRLFF